VALLRKKRLDRTELLAEADRARAAGRRKKAIALYRKVLEGSPNDLATHAKIAPLLARAGRKAEALASFNLAASGQQKAGFSDRALSLQRQAADFFPEEYVLWDDVAKLHLLRGRRADAVAALVDGGRKLHRTPELATAAKVLRRALEIEPWHPDATLLLARVYARGRRAPDALALLDGLSARVRGKALRRARRLAFAIAPTPGNLWRWLRAALGWR
jgi:tetratricopeptide (TPR) repeat protein